MDADSTQHTGKRYLLSDHCQGGAGPPSSDKADIAGDIYSGGTGPITREGKLDCPRPSYVFANTDTAFTENAKIVVSKKERAIVADRQPFGNVRRKSIYSDVVRRFLQLASSIRRAKNTSFLDRRMAKANIKRLAALPSMTGKTGIWVTSQQSKEISAPQLLDPRSFGLNPQAFGHLGCAGKNDLTIHLHQTKLACPIGPNLGQRFEAGIVAEAGDIDASLLHRSENRCPNFGPYFMAVNAQTYLIHWRSYSDSSGPGAPGRSKPYARTFTGT